MHAQRDIDAPGSKLATHVGIRSKAMGFIEDDKLDIRYVGQQRRFCLADDPGDAYAGPILLYRPNNRERVTSITNRRQSDDTYVFRRRIGEQMRQFDFKGRIR